ncbi:histidine phosphatase family protein [Nakamurella antarctica]|uniref:Histidine phosphatase family protein n=1 Tax=Nakamurella antarctica TaxID=1902245 RepID=A0A3G8ZM75_9ACTN|nr:histidine phosphatase family protein [Nakamurella antarctica]AZI58449.1 histidine phosphatase family protein [Nakamurella antarctica]
MTLERLVLMRHGQTDWNVAFRMQGHSNIALNAVGRSQAVAAAPSVAALAPGVIVSSDLDRAHDTALEVAALLGQKVLIDKRLRETHMGQWEGLTRDDVVTGWPGEWAQWRTTSAHKSPPDGESRWQVAQRANQVVTELDAGNTDSALLVVHGGLIVGLTGLLLDLPDAVWGHLIGVNNCHWVVLHRLDGADITSGWRLHSYNAGLASVVIPGGEDEVPGA